MIAKLEAEFARDKVKVNILGFTSLGLLELTRKKVRQSLREILQVECDFCDGTGYVNSLDYLAKKAARSIQLIARNTPGEALLLGVNPHLGSILIGPGGVNLEKMERVLNKVIYIKGQDNLDLTQVRLLASGNEREIESLALPVQEGEEVEIKVSEPHITNPGAGIGRIDGYVVDIEGAGSSVGKQLKVLITKTFKTYAKARIV
mgnify:CR=1 FL=1